MLGGTGEFRGEGGWDRRVLEGTRGAGDRRARRSRGPAEEEQEVASSCGQERDPFIQHPYRKCWDSGVLSPLPVKPPVPGSA